MPFKTSNFRSKLSVITKLFNNSYSTARIPRFRDESKTLNALDFHQSLLQDKELERVKLFAFKHLSDLPSAKNSNHRP